VFGLAAARACRGVESSGLDSSTGLKDSTSSSKRTRLTGCGKRSCGIVMSEPGIVFLLTTESREIEAKKRSVMENEGMKFTCTWREIVALFE
jgi:hypothetical protein